MMVAPVGTINVVPGIMRTAGRPATASEAAIVAEIGGDALSGQTSDSAEMIPAIAVAGPAMSPCSAAACPNQQRERAAGDEIQSCLCYQSPWHDALLDFEESVASKGCDGNFNI